jgi:hypothetical protein
VTFGVPAAYSKGMHLMIAVAEFALVSIAMWSLGASALARNDNERGLLAFIGTTFVLPFALFSLTAGFGPPEAANAPQNELRYILLTIDAALVGIGFASLGQLLAKKGAGAYAASVSISMVFATLLYVLFTLAQLGEFVAEGDQRTVWIESFDRVSLVLLIAGVLLTYASTAMTAVALRRTQLLGRTSSSIILLLSLLAIGFVALRAVVALTSGPMWGFNGWYDLPGFALMIPAVPWLMPCVVGILLLQRAGAQQTGVAAE